VSEESHRNAMNDAIRAQRERGNVPKSMLPPEDDPAPMVAAPDPQPEPDPQSDPEPTPEPGAKRGFLSRLFGR
jgi:hypothetical protein